MSPTYWTASQIIAAARAHGWLFIPCVDGKGPWGAEKIVAHHSPAGERYNYVEYRKVMFEENRRGGLIWVRILRSASGAADATYYGPRHRDKLAVVLAFLRGGPLPDEEIR